jgi:hypothetical protein
MTKLEDVARAIQRAAFEDSKIPWESINPEGKSDYRKYARAAVEALREPTAEMLALMEPWTQVSGHQSLVWKVGIGAILSEKPSHEKSE